MGMKFKCRLCGKNNGGEFAVGICEPCSDEVSMWFCILIRYNYMDTGILKKYE